MGPYDTEFLLLAHADRVESMRRSAASAPRARRPRRFRRRLANLLITAGMRLAAEPAPRTRAVQAR
jgi:hypothetical protein